MTPRERILAVYDGESTGVVPTDYSATKEFTATLCRHLGVTTVPEIWEKLGIDAVVSVGPERRADRPAPPDGDWGVRYQEIDYGAGKYREVAYSPLAEATSIADIRRHRWPDPDDWDFSGVSERLAKLGKHRAIMGGAFQAILQLCELRGLEQTLMDFAADPEMLIAILDHQFEFHYELNRRLFEAARGQIDIGFLSSDLGSQTGPLISVEQFRRVLLPPLKRMAELYHRYGVRVFFHSDGAIAPFIPILIDEVGIDALNPIQWRCEGMGREKLAAMIGDRIVLHGAIDQQQTLVFGSPEDVTREVRETARIFEKCRWICASCHSIQPGTSPENVVAMYQAVHELNRK